MTKEQQESKLKRILPKVSIDELIPLENCLKARKLKDIMNRNGDNSGSRNDGQGTVLRFCGKMFLIFIFASSEGPHYEFADSESSDGKIIRCYAKRFADIIGEDTSLDDKELEQCVNDLTDIVLSREHAATNLEKVPA